MLPSSGCYVGYFEYPQPQSTKERIRILIGEAHSGDVRAIDARYLKFNDSNCSDLWRLDQIQDLVLDETQVTDAGLGALRGMSQLRIITLNKTKITDAGLVHLYGLRNLIFVRFEDTSVTKAGAEELQRALPTCEIDGP